MFKALKQYRQLAQLLNEQGFEGGPVEQAKALIAERNRILSRSIGLARTNRDLIAKLTNANAKIDRMTSGLRQNAKKAA